MVLSTIALRRRATKRLPMRATRVNPKARRGPLCSKLERRLWRKRIRTSIPTRVNQPRRFICGYSRAECSSLRNQRPLPRPLRVLRPRQRRMDRIELAHWTVPSASVLVTGLDPIIRITATRHNRCETSALTHCWVNTRPPKPGVVFAEYSTKPLVPLILYSVVGEKSRFRSMTKRSKRGWSASNSYYRFIAGGSGSDFEDRSLVVDTTEKRCPIESTCRI